MDIWRDLSGKTELLAVCLITTVPNHLVEEIHYRMPVIIEPRFYSVWLIGLFVQTFTDLSQNVPNDLSARNGTSRTRETSERLRISSPWLKLWSKA